jgi:hypothetical protein
MRNPSVLREKNFLSIVDRASVDQQGQAKTGGFRQAVVPGRRPIDTSNLKNLVRGDPNGAARSLL